MDAISPAFRRRKDAGAYLKKTYGFGAARTLAKLACVGGGPVFRKAGAVVLYETSELDRWALSKISAPRLSTSDRPEAVQNV